MMAAFAGILLTVLKTAGLILLTLLCVVLLLLICVLLVPVRYKAAAEFEDFGKPPEGKKFLEQKFQLDAEISWLLHFLHVTLHYSADGMSAVIRIAGIDTAKLMETIQKRKGKKKRRPPREKGTTEKLSVPETEDNPPDSIPGLEKPSGDTDRPKADTAPIKDTIQKDITAKMQDDRNPASHPQEESADGKKEKKGRGPRQKSASSREKNKEKKDSIHQKLRSAHAEFTDTHNRSALAHAWQELLYLLCHYKPRKVRADLTFSLADPALTGQAVGVLSLMPAIFRQPCKIIPDFETDRIYITGSLSLKGRIRSLHAVLSLLRLYRDKEIKHVIAKQKGIQTPAE